MSKSNCLKIGKLPKTAHCAYIYEDGHAVVIHQQRHDKAGDVEWAVVYEKLDIHCQFTGRIVFHHLRYDRLFQEAANAYSLRASTPSVESGSENTKRMGIRVGNLTVESKDGKSLYWTLMPDLISNGITYQPECKESFSDLEGKYFFGSTRIAEMHRLPAEQTAEQVAA